ncbi:MAG: hypothetical protein EA393_04095 [Bacteroidetes bacterium]|nr:MAG: hypothetical protein EA393_04095 [Bacteroidota bacterium]
MNTSDEHTNVGTHGSVVLKVWLVTAKMGYGHLRAVYPLQELAYEGILSVGDNQNTPEHERRLWKKILGIYEFLSRAKGTPIIGKLLYNILDFFLRIPSFYPRRDLSKTTFQVKMLNSSIRKGLCKGMLDKIREERLPVLSSFYAPAIAADMQGQHSVFCIICDTDLNRVWVSPDPWESRIEYFVPTGRAARRLKDYGVPENRIHLTGFPLPKEVLGSPQLDLLKSDLGQRLHYLDPKQRFWPFHRRNIEYFLGKDNCDFKNLRKLTITYAVGGAGAQREFGKKIALSLKEKLLAGNLTLNLVAGTRVDVQDYFLDIQEEINSENIHVIFGKNFHDYFHKFNQIIRQTDILWSKPSELSFYVGLGIPLIMTPTIGAQERANKKWIRDIQAGFKQEDPSFTDQWLFDMLFKGRLAESAWAGFLKARKKGVFNIENFLKNGQLPESGQLIR